MRKYNRLALAILATVLLTASVNADNFHSWENSLEGWSVDPDSFGGTAFPTNSAPAGAITDGNYALQVGRTGTGWTSVVRAENTLFYDDLIYNSTLDLDVFVPSSSFQGWGNMRFILQGEGMSISETLTFNSTHNAYHLSWDYGSDPGFNPTADWSQLTMAIHGVGTMDPLYLDNFQLSNSFSGLPSYAVEGNHKVFLNEQFDGDLKIWRESSDLYSGPDTVAAGDGSLIRGAVGEPGWRTRFTFGGEIGGRALAEKEAGWYTDPWYEGTTGSPLGVNPFTLQNGKLHIAADEISPTVLNGLPTEVGDINDIHDRIDYTSGILTTEKLAAVKYGHFEMRAQLPSGTGLWPAFWLLRKEHEWPPEIDILEAHGQRPEEVHIAAHLTQDDLDAGFSPIATWVDTDVATPGNPVDITAGFHDYALDWGADEIIWYFDGVEIGRMDTPPSMQEEMYLLVNLAVGGPDSWPGAPDPGTPFPQEMIVDYIRVTQLLADYDNDGDVDQADYAVWQSTFGQSVTPGEGADGNHDGIVDAADYTVWRDGLALSPFGTSSSESVPEPSTGVFLLLTLVGLSSVSRAGLPNILLTPAQGKRQADQRKAGFSRWITNQGESC